VKVIVRRLGLKWAVIVPGFKDFIVDDVLFKTPDDHPRPLSEEGEFSASLLRLEVEFRQHRPHTTAIIYERFLPGLEVSA